jgi:subtilisin family serine protease
MNLKIYASSSEQYDALHKAMVASIPIGSLYLYYLKDEYAKEKDFARNILSTYFSAGWYDNNAFCNILKEVGDRLQERKNNIPVDKYNTGSLVSTKAGEVAEHFVVSYGQNILSAGADQGYLTMSGSSQAAPIVTGMLVLCHKYLNESYNVKTTWIDLIQTAKLTARSLGRYPFRSNSEIVNGVANKFFGRGIPDPNMLIIQRF